MDVFDLVAKITLDSSEYEQGLESAEQSAGSFGQKIKGGIGKAAKVGAGAVLAIGAASTAASVAFVKGAGNVAAYGDNIDKMSQKMGMSSDTYQEWDAVMRHSGTSMETMQASMKTLASAVETGSDAFDKLGLSQEQLSKMSQEELFETTITALQGVEDETERTYLAGKLLGRGATELGALLNTSADDTAKMRKRVHELGGVMDKRGVKAAARYQDSLQDMNTAISSIGRNLMTSMLPSMSTVMDGITEIFAGDSDKGIGMVTSGIDSLIDTIGQKMPKMMEVAGKLMTALGTAISTNLPKIITAAVGFITSSLPGAITGLITIAVPAITSLITSIAQSLPGMMKNIWDAIKNVAPTLLATISSLVSQIPSALGGIISAIGGWITSNASSFAMHGSEIWDAIVSGISSAIDTIGNALAGIGGKILDWINGDGLADLNEGGSTLWEKIKEGFVNALSDIGQLVLKIVTGIGTWITQNYDSIAQAGKNILTYIVEGIVAVVSDVATGLLGLVGAIIQWVADNRGQILNVGISILGAIVAGIASVISTVVNGFVDFISNISTWFTDHQTEIEAFGNDVITFISNGIEAWISHIKDGFANFISTVYSWLSGIRESLKNVGKNVISYIKAGITAWIDKLADWVKDLPSKISNAVVALWEDFKAIGGKIIDAILAGLADLGSKIKEAVKNAVPKVIDVPVAAKVSASMPDEHGVVHNAKARYKPYLFNKATVFGRYNGVEQVAGEAGPEMLLGTHALQGMLFESVQGGMQSMMGQIYDMMSGMQTSGGNSMLEAQILDVLNRYLPGIAERQLVLDTGAIAGAVAPGVNAALGTQVGSRRRYNA